MASRRGFEQQFFLKRVAHLHSGEVFVRVFAEVGGGERSPVNAVLASGRADDEHRVAGAARCCAHRFTGFHDACGHGVDQNIVVVARHEIHLATHRRHPEAVAVVADALHHARDEAAHTRVVRRTKAEGVEGGDGPCAHGENVAVDAAYASGCALVRLDSGGVVVAFDFENTTQAVADVHEARVFFACCYEQSLAAAGEGF